MIERFLKKQRLYQGIRRIALYTILLSIVGLFFKWFFLFLIIILCLFIITYTQEQFEKQAISFKQNQLKDEIEKAFPTICYNMHQGIPSSDVFQSKLLKKDDIYQSEDLLYGKINNRRFRSADVTTKYLRMSRNGHQEVTTFKGRYYEIELPFTVKSPVYIVNNNADLFGHRLGIEKVELEYVDFNREVDVFSKDQLAAFKLLKPKFMEAILKLRKQYGSIAFGFMNKTMVVAINNKNSFEFYIHRKVNIQLLKSIEEEITNLVSLTNILEQ